MNVLPKLTKGIFYYHAKDGRFHKDCEIWGETNLCITLFRIFNKIQRGTVDPNPEFVNDWRISQLDTGMFILSKMKSKEQAIEYMMQLGAIRKNWSGTKDEIKHIPGLEDCVKALQDRIDKSNEE